MTTAELLKARLDNQKGLRTQELGAAINRVYLTRNDFGLVL